MKKYIRPVTDCMKFRAANPLLNDPGEGQMYGAIQGTGGSNAAPYRF